MKKLFFVSSCLLFSATVVTTGYAFDCRKLTYNCSDYGYSDNKATVGTCSNGWVACPIDANYRRCDKEASINDFKFSRVTESGSLWTSVNWSGKFIVVAGSSYCGVALKNTGSNAVPTHKHLASSSLSNAQLSCPGRERCTWYQTDNMVLSTSTIGKVATDSYGDTETRPFSYTLYGFEYTGSASGTISGNYVFSSSNTSRPSCDELGYKHKINQCPGSYIVCPFDVDAADSVKAVLCDLEAKAGEIKFSKKSGDHNGWLQVNDGKGGRTLSSIGNAYYNSELGKNKGITTLPNYSGAFFRVTGGNATTVGNYQGDSIKPHTHQIKANGNQGGSSGTLWSEKSGVTYYPYSTTYTYNSYTGNSDRFNGSETRPYNYGANVFIYTGLLNI